MTKYTGTRIAPPGLYFNWTRRTMTHHELAGPLPGTGRERYIRVPMLLMLAAAPIMGLVFVIFLPFIGFAMVAKLLGDKLLHAAQTAMRERRLAKERGRRA